MADGSIVINAAVDDKKAQAELNRLINKINNLNEKIRQAEDARFPLVERADELGARLDAAKAKLAEMQMASAGTFSSDQIADQKETVKSLQAQWNEVQGAVERYDRTIANSTAQIGQAEERVGMLSAQLSEAGDAGSEAGSSIAAGISSATNSIKKLERRIVGLIKRVFIFSVITQALRGMRTWLNNAIKSNDEASAAIARLKGALLTLAQPLLNVIIPAFTMLVNVLTQVVSAVARVVSALFGMTASESAEAAENLYKEQNAIKGVGGAAKKASKQLAGFDEIQKLSGESAGGGGSSSSTIAPDFSGIGDEVSGKMKNILADVLAIGAGLLAWKIASNFTNDLSTLAGVAMAVAGAIMFVTNAFDAWENGVDWDNLIGMVAGLTLVVIGLYIALGPLAAGIAAIVGGLAMFAIGMKDAADNGMNWKNTLLMITGLLAAGLGIGMITGNWLPLLLAALAGAVLALVMFTGHGEELMDGLKEVFEGFSDFLSGAFTGDWEKAFEGLKKIGSGFVKVWNAIVSSVKDAWAKFVGWFDEKTNGEFHYVLESIGMFFAGVFDAIKTVLSGIVDFIAGVFTGDWDRAWTGVKNIFIGLWNGIVSAVEAAINFLISGINAVQQGIVDALNGLIKFPDWMPLVGGKSLNLRANVIDPISLPRVPALAQGAVIPPNREFLAVLGDQKSGTNIEAPLATLVEAFRQANAESGRGRPLQVIFEVDRREFGRVVYEVGNEETQRVGVKFSEVSV